MAQLLLRLPSPTEAASSTVPARRLLRQQLDVSTMDAEFRSYNMVLMIHPQFSSILLSIFIAIAQFTGLQYVFSVNLGSSNILK